MHIYGVSVTIFDGQASLAMFRKNLHIIQKVSIRDDDDDDASRVKV